MPEDVDEEQLGPEELAALAEITEEILGRLESGEPLIANDLVSVSPTGAGLIRQLLPTLRTMVSLGEQVARDEASRARPKAKDRGASE